MTDINVVLLENVKNVGLAGDVVNVSEGYARNYLFTNGLAAQATDGRVKEVEKKAAKKQEEQKMLLEEVQKQVDSIDGKTIPMKLKVGPEGQAFGSISAKDITVEIEKAIGTKLSKSVVRLKSPIKQIGETPVHLEFPHALEADVIVVVEGEEDKSAKIRA
ncbi:MAG: 50S ribosomal protein L9 [bacterium]|nr:50S ribosomal protein L9 [bacterium]